MKSLGFSALLLLALSAQAEPIDPTFPATIGVVKRITCADRSRDAQKIKVGDGIYMIDVMMWSLTEPTIHSPGFNGGTDISVKIDNGCATGADMVVRTHFNMSYEEFKANTNLPK